MPDPQLDPDGWDPAVHRRLLDLLRRPVDGPAPLAVFDWDDTIARGDLSLALLRRSDAARGTRWHDTYFELLEAEGRAVAYPQITRWYAGRTPAEFSAWAAEVVEAALAAGEVAIRPPMRALVQALLTAGWDLHVVTASPALLIAPLASRLGLDPDKVHGMRLRTAPDGRMTEVLDGPPTFGPGKRRIVEERIGRRPTLVAGDSSSDQPMMELSEEVLLIDGHDRDLRAVATERGWMIQAGWEHTAAEPGLKGSAS